MSWKILPMPYYSMHEIVECHMTSGGFDFVVKIRCASMDEFRKISGQVLWQLPGVKETRSYPVMEVIKESSRIQLKYKPFVEIIESHEMKKRGLKAPIFVGLHVQLTLCRFFFHFSHCLFDTCYLLVQSVVPLQLQGLYPLSLQLQC